jgi:hypothetical protein
MSWFNDVWNTITGGGNSGGDPVSAAVSAAESGTLAEIGAIVIHDLADHLNDLVTGLTRMARLLADAYVGALLGGMTGQFLFELADALGFSVVQQLYNFLAKLRVPRRLKCAEQTMVNGVFNVASSQVLPTNRIFVTPFLGVNNRAFTIPVSLVLLPGVVQASLMLGGLYWPLAAMVAAMNLSLDAYLVNLGPNFYDNDATGYSPDIGDGPGPGRCVAPGHTLIHECTHIWQGEHWSDRWSYVFDSVDNNVLHGDSAYSYDYDKNRQWNSYAAEQQASIVEDWFIGNFLGNCPYAPKSCSNPLYRFIKANVQQGDNDRRSDESLLCAPAAAGAGLTAGNMGSMGSSLIYSGGGGGPGPVRGPIRPKLIAPRHYARAR